MDLSLISKSAKTLGRSIDRNSPTILTALAVVGVVSTVIMAVKATPKALEAIEQEETFRSEEQDDDRPLDIPGVIEATWRLYLPSTIMGVTTITCIVVANHISLRRNAALISLLSLAETAAREYHDKVVEQIGEKKAEKIDSEVVEDRMKRNPPEEKTVIITGSGDYMCYDVRSDRYFRSNVEVIRKAVNEFNRRLLNEMWLSINEFYWEIGLGPVELGDEFGWIAERGLMEPKFHTVTHPTTQEPCLALDFINKPIHI